MTTPDPTPWPASLNPADLIKTGPIPSDVRFPPAPDPTPGNDLRGLVDALYSARWPNGDRVLSIGPGPMPYLTAAILDSDWLAERDRRVRQEAEARALREAANDLERRAGDFKHLPGDKDIRRAHNDVARWLRSRARRIKAVNK